MSTKPTLTIPSLSGTFGISARLAFNPKMPKELSSLSHSTAQLERQYIKNLTNRLECQYIPPYTVYSVLLKKPEIKYYILILTICCLAINFVYSQNNKLKQDMKTELILIDIQNDYFEKGTMTLAGYDKASENARLLLDKFRADSLPIIHIQHNFFYIFLLFLVMRSFFSLSL